MTYSTDLRGDLVAHGLLAIIIGAAVGLLWLFWYVVFGSVPNSPKLWFIESLPRWWDVLVWPVVISASIQGTYIFGEWLPEKTGGFLSSESWGLWMHIFGCLFCYTATLIWGLPGAIVTMAASSLLIIFFHALWYLWDLIRFCYHGGVTF